ncbi:hypothetical protein [uncultured Bacteroides sp.]|uniref:hypothetical protein n=1 Tax=uncultured Bacteroides sp. TaxID=162156 RepID=UPI002AA6DB46|nr:hypothetical protein [uncultured Bacteroides sp.]
MKLLVVLSIREYQGEVAKLLEKAGVSIFSVSDTTGYKKRAYNVGWFGSANGKANSIVLFSFTDEVSAYKALENINQCNTDCETPFPVRGFVLAVEEFSKIM